MGQAQSMTELMRGAASAVSARKAREMAERRRPYEAEIEAVAEAARERRAELAVPEPRYYIDVMDIPPPEPIDGAALLTDTARFKGTYVCYPSLITHAVSVLWTASALCRDRDEQGMGPLIWPAHARLGVTSKDNKSGKTTELDTTRLLLQTTRPSKVTGRSVAHKLGRSHKALCLDEVKLLFHTGLASQDVQSVLLNGYSAGATWEITSGNHELEIPCYGPVAYAARDDLITSTQDRLFDLFDRTIWIRMERPMSLRPQMDVRATEDARLLNESLVMWTNEAKDDLISRYSQLADADYERSLEAAQEGRKIDARRPQLWRPLLTVADVAGGPWPILARRAMNGQHDEAVAAQRAIRVRAGERWAEFNPDEELGNPAAAGSIEPTGGWTLQRGQP